MIWLEIKIWLVTVLSLERDALHIYAALAVQLTVAGVFRLRLDSLWPLVAVVAVEVANEAADLAYEQWPNRGDQWRGSIHDLLNTVAVPILVILVARVSARRARVRAQ